MQSARIMNIFIREIPDILTGRDLQRLVNQILKPRWRLPFQRRDIVRECRIIRISDKGSNAVESHGLVRVTNSKTGQEIIRKLNGSSLLGRRIEVRKYIQRSASRDRRIPNAHLDIFFDNDRRRGDRRRPHVIIGSAESPEVKGMDHFHRTYG